MAEPIRVLEDVYVLPDAQEQGVQCGGGAMHVWRGATLYEVAGIPICEDCLPDVFRAMLRMANRSLLKKTNSAIK